MPDTHDAPGQRLLIAAAAEGFAQALAAPLTALTNQVAAQGRSQAELVQALNRLAQAVEAIQARLTPKEERAKVVTVNGYVRSSNNGGELVWLYGAHPGLQWKVATVYGEDFGHLRPYLDPSAGRVYDGEVAPSRAAAAQKGYLNPTAEFSVVLQPTGRQTENGQPIYDFQAARPVGSAPPAVAEAGASTRSTVGGGNQPIAAPAPAPLAPPVAPEPAPSADALFDALVSASVERGRTAGPAPAPQAVVVGAANGPYMACEAEFARQDARYRAAAGEPDRVRIRQLVYALGRRERDGASRFARITPENLAEVQAVLTAYAARAAGQE